MPLVKGIPDSIENRRISQGEEETDLTATAPPCSLGMEIEDEERPEVFQSSGDLDSKGDPGKRMVLTLHTHKYTHTLTFLNGPL